MFFWIPASAGMTNIVKGFMTRYGSDGGRTRPPELWVFARFANNSVIVNTIFDVTVNLIDQFVRY